MSENKFKEIVQIKDLQKPEFKLVDVDIEVHQVLENIGSKQEYDYLFVVFGDGEYLAVYGTYGIPYLENTAELVYQKGDN